VDEVMDIETIKIAKRKCESEILAIINVFEEQSECFVYDINLHHIEHFGRHPTVVSTELDVRIKG
jgi:hypothetical protein